MRGRFLTWILAVLLAGAMGFAQAPPQVAPKAAKPAQAPHAHHSGSYLGVEPQDVSPDRVGALKLGEARGVEITMVDQDAPAGKAGLQEHDVILSFNGRKIETAQGLRQLLHETPPGRLVILGISRDGRAMNVNVTLATHRQVLAAAHPGGASGMPGTQMPTMDFVFPQFSIVPCWGRNGMVVEDLTPQLGKFFGLRNNAGVLVRSVAGGSTADAAGMNAGDVIVKVNGIPVTSGANWRHLMREQRGNTVTLGIVRERRGRTLSMKLPEPRISEALGNFPDLGPELEGLQEELGRMGPELQRSLAAEHAQALREIERAMREVQEEWQQSQPEQESQGEHRVATPR